MAQEDTRKTIKGKATAYANSTEGIDVINMQTEKNTITEASGYFSIPVQVGDTLVFSSTQFKARKVAISETDINNDLLLVKLEPIMNKLDEVQVFQYKNINAVALGIISKDQKTYTPAERRYKTAMGYDAQIGLNTSLTIDPLFNLLSGRAAELRKNLLIEKKEMLLDKIDYLFERDYFVQKLKIPEEHVKGFQFYLVENDRFVASLHTKNKTMATFIMGELAVKYLEIIAVEKK